MTLVLWGLLSLLLFILVLLLCTSFLVVSFDVMSEVLLVLEELVALLALERVVVLVPLLVTFSVRYAVEDDSTE